MKKIIILSLFCTVIGIQAQSAIDRLMKQIEQNNPNLAVLRQHLEAEKIGTRTGLYPDNPEVDLGFLNGKPTDLGRKTNFSIHQTFDFPLAYLHRGRLAGVQRDLLDWQYKLQSRNLLLEAHFLAIDLVHANALIREKENHLKLTRELVNAFRARFESGEANILEYNKARITELEIEKELERTLIDQQSLLADLTRLNGGLPVELSDSQFEPVPLTEDFTTWYERIEPRIPELQLLKSDREGLDTQVILERALYLPKITLGYMSEAVDGEKFSGFTAGFSIPLFERKNRVTIAKKLAETGRSMEEIENKQIRSSLKSLYEQAAALDKSASDYHTRLTEFDITPLLKKALLKGEISVIEYVNEISAFFDNRIQLLQMERDLCKTLARLLRYNA